MKVIELKGGVPRIGLNARNGISGPERDLVEAFEPFVPSCFRWRTGSIAVFHEPRLETGFPDLVIAQYEPRVFSSWVPERSYLRSMDLKVLHHLTQGRGEKSVDLLRTLGLDARSLLSTLERLMDARMVTRSRAKWIPRPVKSLFGIRAIVAVEAKIKNWSEAFSQCQLDQWFASHSYVLSPVEKPGRPVVDRSRRTGVGILLLNGKGVRRFRSAEKRSIPASYGSWMLNEWIGRHLHGGNVGDSWT